MPSAALKQAEIDHRQRILDELGDISEIEIAQNEVLLAIYRRPEKTAAGIVLPHQNLKEDKFQGKVGLVVKIGAACRFVRTNELGIQFGIPIKLHDWIVVRPSDTWALDINSNPNVSDPNAFVWCRMVFDDQIRMKIPHPEMIW